MPAVRLRGALAAGLTTFGENRIQEAEPKVAEIVGATWHLVGHLQSNKAGKAVDLFDVIESVDSVDLARRLARLANESGERRRLPIYLQVNVDRDPNKAGFDPDSLATALPGVLDVDDFEVRGLMTVGRVVGDPEDARSTFRGLRDLSAALRATDTRLGAGLSMGMSDDFEIAVEEGATVVRIGRALFGER